MTCVHSDLSSLSSVRLAAPPPPAGGLTGGGGGRPRKGAGVRGQKIGASTGSWLRPFLNAMFWPLAPDPCPYFSFHRPISFHVPSGCCCSRISHCEPALIGAATGAPGAMFGGAGGLNKPVSARPLSRPPLPRMAAPSTILLST